MLAFLFQKNSIKTKTFLIFLSVTATFLLFLFGMMLKPKKILSHSSSGMVLKPKKILSHNSNGPVHLITFEDYLKQQSVLKNSKALLLTNKNHKKPELRLRLLEHPVLVAGRKPKWRILREKLQKLLKPIKKPVHPKILPVISTENKCVAQAASRWRAKVLKDDTLQNRLKSIPLPKLLSFLRARNDDGLCARKSGFEIYCEMASIHGFINFVGSTTAQRAFWSFVLFVAIAISVGILVMSHILNESTPTILYMESTQYPSWPIPFPGVTICNLNRISKAKAQKVAETMHKPSNLTSSQLMGLFHLALYATEIIVGTAEEFRQLADVLEFNKISLEHFVDSIAPDCESQILRCKWKGRFGKCSKLFKKVQTTYGKCCSFNERSLKKSLQRRNDVASNADVEYSTSCGPETGLTVLLDPQLQDYQFSSHRTNGFQVFIHDSYDFTHTTTRQRVLSPRTVNRISVIPQQTYASDYIRQVKVRTRRCYLHQERQLFFFPSYSQRNCFAECRSSILYEQCQCTLGKWPKKAHWRECGLRDVECFMQSKALMKPILKSVSGDYRNNHYAEQFICDCFPSCDFNIYNFFIDSAKLERTFSLSNKRFFKDINITQQIMLQVFNEELYAERLRLDVFENWLSFIATVGGITGLQMGYSVVSGFELIFFVFVRPACNWLTKKQIRYRIKRRQRKAKKEAEKKRKEQEEKEKQEKIEAFLRMRPYCPGY